MKEKRGFTLIELLAVIVILAIIALIATPIVLSLIDRARHGAAEDSAYGVRKEAQLLYQTTMMGRAGAFNKIEVDFSKTMEKDGKTYVETKLYETASSAGETNKVFFEADGTTPTNGRITIHGDGTVDYEVLTISNYYCCIPAQGNVTCAKENNFDGNCNSTGSESNPSGGSTTNPTGDPTTPDPAPTTLSTDLATVPSGCPIVGITPSLATAASSRTVTINFAGLTNGQYKKDSGSWVNATDDYVVVGFDENGTLSVKSDGCADGVDITVNNITHTGDSSATLSYSVNGNTVASGFYLTGPLSITLTCTEPNSTVASHSIMIYDATSSSSTPKRTYTDNLTVTYDPSTDTYTEGALLVTGSCTNANGETTAAQSSIFFYTSTAQPDPDCTDPTAYCHSYVYSDNCGLETEIPNPEYPAYMTDAYVCTEQQIDSCDCDGYDKECSEANAACVFASSNDPIVTPLEPKQEAICNNLQAVMCSALVTGEKALCIQKYYNNCVTSCNSVPIGEEERTKCLNVCSTTTYPPCEKIEDKCCPNYIKNVYTGA